MSSVRGPVMLGNFSRSLRMIARVSSTDSVVCEMKATRSGSSTSSALDVLLGLDQHDVVGRLAHRALDLLVAGVADQHDRVALGGELLRLDVHLGDQRAGGVDRLQLARAGVRVHARRDAVGGEDDGLALGHLGLLLHEDRAALAQLLDHVLVVHDLLAHVHGRPVELERALDRLDGAVDARRSSRAGRRAAACRAWRASRSESREQLHHGFADRVEAALRDLGEVVAGPVEAGEVEVDQVDRRALPGG